MNDFRELDIQVEMPHFVVERQPDAGWSYSGSSADNQCVIGYAKCGEAFYTLGDKVYTVGKGDIVFFPMGAHHTAKSNPDDPWAFYSVCFTLSFGDERSRELIGSLPNIFRCSGSSRMAADFADLSRVWSTREKGYKLKCRSLLLDIIFMILSDEDRRRFSSAHYEKLSAIIDMMSEQYAKSWSSAELAGIAGLSESHFRMLFRQLTGYSPVQFQNHLRIERAKDLLLSKSCNVTEAAEAVGFTDIYYFSRMFKKLTGRNPSEFM